MTLTQYNITSSLFNKIDELHKVGGKSSTVAGQLFEDFNKYALPYYVRSDIVKVWDTNDHKSIPPKVIKELFGQDWKLIKQVFQGASYGLDKIVQFNDGTYGFVSDKSTKNETLSKEKIEGLFTLYPKLNETVSEWIVCSNAKRVPDRVGEVVKDIVTFILYDDYVPEKLDTVSQQKEKVLWSIIQNSLSKKPKKIEAFKFAFRNTLQEDYVNPSVDFAVEQFEDGIESVLHWAEGTMGLGKSLLDQYIASVVQNKCWNKDYTNTDVPININVFDRRKNAKQNGARMIDIRKQFCKAFKTIWITGAEGVKDDSGTIPFKQIMNVNKIVLEILSCIKKGISVEIVTLVHHANLLKQVEEDLKQHFDGFRFWNLNIDELDLLATLDKASSWNKWFTIDACRRFGSTGTPVYSKGKVSKDHPFMDNLKRFGPRTSYISVKQAQDHKLIPPLCTYLVGVKLSEIKSLPKMPFKPVKGTPILETPVKGFNTIVWKGKDRYLNVEELSRFYAVIKTFIIRPELFLNKKLTGFTNFYNQAQLFKENYKFIIDQIEGNTLIGRKLKGLLIELLNEVRDDSINEKKIASVFDEKEAMVISQKLLGRGVDLQFYTAFHLVLKTARQMLQEIFRLMRLDDSLAWEEQTRHYILPVVINDINADEPTVDQEFVDRLNAILQFNESAKTEMEEAWKTGSSTGKKGGSGVPRAFEAINLTVGDLDTVVKHCAARDPKGGMLATNFERLHTKMLDDMLKLPVPTSLSKQHKVLVKFKDDKDLQEVLSLYNRDIHSIIKSIWRGDKFLCRNSKIIRKNVQTWKLHLEDYREKRANSLASVLPMIRRYYKENNLLITKVSLDIRDRVLAKLEKIGIETRILSGKRKGQISPFIVGSLVKGINSNLDKRVAKQQQAWYAKNVIDKGTKKRQQALDYAVEHWKLLDTVQPFARKFDIGKREMTCICYHPNVYPCKTERHDGAKYKHLDRSVWNTKVEQEIAKMKQVADRVFEIYKSRCEAQPFQYTYNCDGKGRSKLIIDTIKNEFDVELNHGNISSLVGPFSNETTRQKLDNFDGSYTRWDHLPSDKHAINRWHDDFNNKVSKLRSEVGKQISQFGYAKVMRDHNYNIGGELGRKLKDEYEKKVA